MSEYSFKAPASAFPDAEDLGDTDLHIRPPAASEIAGTEQRIDSREELEALIGGSL